MKKQIIAQGAEAILIKQKNILVKDRVCKGYRNKIIDKTLRKKRTRSEAKIIAKASLVIDVPKILKIDEDKSRIEMEFLSGEKLSEYLDEMPHDKALEICKKIGENVAKLHDIDIIHGDLTTSNMILQGEKVFFIDFGLSFHSQRIEDKAVDLHLLRQAFESKHFRHWKDFFNSVLQGYSHYKKHNEVLKQLEKVELRGRYKHK